MGAAIFANLKRKVKLARRGAVDNTLPLTKGTILMEDDNWVSICEAAKSLMRKSVEAREAGKIDLALKYHREAVKTQLEDLVKDQ